MRFIGYFLYILVVIFLIIKGSHYENFLQMQRGSSNNPTPYFSFVTIFPVGIGLLLSLPQLFHKLKKPGIWSYDWVKILAVGIPTLLINGPVLICFSPLGKLISPVCQTLISFIGPSFMLPVTACGIMFGYTLLSALEKEIRY